MSRTRDERGSTIPLIAGFVGVLVLAVGVMVNASAAFLQRQALDTLAEGAALRGADLGAAGVYAEGVPDGRLLQADAEVRQAVYDYLAGADTQQVGSIDVGVNVDAAARTVTVTLHAPADLPFHVPGTPLRPVIGASGTAAVEVIADP